MNLINLYDLIKHIEYGTNLHISILFFGHYGNDIFHLPHNHIIHFNPVCNTMKSMPNGLKKCFKCRNMAIAKARKTKESFGGICINGVYEFVHPVFLNNDILCIIFIGNIMNNNKKTERFPPQLIDTMEHDFSFEKSNDLAIFIENYIRMMLPYISHNLSLKKSSLIENIKNYIQENTYSKNNISEIADIFHYNAKYIGQLFKKETGISFNEYVNIIRLEQAKILLSESDKTILDIAFEIGYNSVSYFNRVFKNHFYVTPTEYRKMVRQLD